MKKVQRAYAEVFKYKRVEWTLAALYRQGYILERFGQTIIETPVPPEVKRLGERGGGRLPGPRSSSRPWRSKTRPWRVYAATLDEAKKNRVSNEWTKKTLESLNRYRPKEYPVLKEPKPAIATDVTWPDGLVSTAAPQGEGAGRPGQGRCSPRRPSKRPRKRRRRRVAQTPAARGGCYSCSVRGSPPRPRSGASAAAARRPPPRPPRRRRRARARPAGGPVDADTQAAHRQGRGRPERRPRRRAPKRLPGRRRQEPQGRLRVDEPGRARRAQGRRRAAEADYRKGARPSPEPPESWDFLARLRYAPAKCRRGRVGAARGRIQEAPTALGARNALVYALLADQARARGRGRGEEGAQGRRAQRPRHAAARAGLPQGQERARRLVLENARAVDPTDAATHNALGLVLLSSSSAPRPWSRSRRPPRSARLRRGAEQLRRDAGGDAATTTAR